MSKTLGNFFTLRDLLAKGYTGREVRQLLLSAIIAKHQFHPRRSGGAKPRWPDR